MTSQLPDDVGQALGDLYEEAFGQLDIESALETFGRLSSGDIAAAESLYQSLKAAEENLEINYDACFQDIDNGLESWTGDAATAFEQYMSELQAAVKEHMIVLRHMQGIVKGFQEAPKHAREQLVKIASGTATALEALPGPLKIALDIANVVFNVASGYLTAGFGAAEAVSIALSANSAASSMESLIGGDDELEIWGNFGESLTNLINDLDDEVGNMKGAAEVVTADLETGKVPAELGSASPTFDGDTPFDPSQFTLEDEDDMPTDLAPVDDSPLLDGPRDKKNQAAE